MTTRTLVAYYSMGGNTRVIANEIGNAVDADIEEITEPRRRHGIGGVMRAMVDAVMRRSPISSSYASTHRRQRWWWTHRTLRPMPIAPNWGSSPRAFRCRSIEWCC